MTSKFKFIALMLLSAGMGLYWYPLAKLESLQIESAQLLFFAFSSASILTVPFMAREANTWRKKTFELLIYALTGGASTVLLQFAFLQGSSTVVVSLFCMAVLVVFFFNSMLSKQSFAISDFLLFLTLMLSASLLLLIANGLAVVQWWQLFAVLSGVGASRLFGVGEEDGSSIPVMTRVASIFLVSTWLVGMVLIFSPLSASFPKEHSTLFSFLYGAIVLVPIVAATVMIFQQHALRNLLLWVTLVLSFNLFGVVFNLGTTSVRTLLLLMLLFLVAYCIQLKQWKNLSQNNHSLK